MVQNFDQNPYGYYPGAGYYNMRSQSRSTSAFDSFEPTVFAPEFVGKPVEEYRNLMTTLNERNNSILDTVDTLDIALSNMNVRDDDAMILNQAKDSLKGGVGEISGASDYNKMNGVLRKLYRDFAGNKGLNLAQAEWQKEQEYINKIQEQAGTAGFTQAMAENAVKLAKMNSSGLQVNPETGIWSGGFKPYQPHEYVDIGKMLHQFGAGWKEDTLKKLKVYEDFDSRGNRILRSTTDGSISQIKYSDIYPYMMSYIQQEGAPIEYLRDRFRLTHMDKEWQSEEHKALAEQEYIDTVLRNYVDAYSKRADFSSIQNEESVDIDPWESLARQGKIDATSPQRFYEKDSGVVVENKVSDMLDVLDGKNINESFAGNMLDLANSIPGLGDSGYAVIAAALTSLGYNLYTDLTSISPQDRQKIYNEIANSDMGIIHKEATLLALKTGNLFLPGTASKQVQAEKMAENIGRNLYGINKKFSDYSEEEKELVKTAGKSIKNGIGYESTIETTPGLIKETAERLFGYNFTATGGKTPRTEVEKDGQVRGALRSRSIMSADMETLSQKQVTKLIEELKEGDALEVLGVYDYRNPFPLITDNDSYASGAVKVLLGEEIYYLSADRTEAGVSEANRILNRAFIAETNPDLSGVPYEILHEGNRYKGEIFKPNDALVGFRLEEGREIKANTLSEIYQKLK